MDKQNMNANTVTVESNESTVESPSLELEIRRSRKVRTGVKAGVSRTVGQTPVTER